MKKIIGFISCAATAALFLSACTAENLRNDNENVGKTVTVHFGTENTNPSTKATLTPDAGETAFQAAWESGNMITVKYTYVADNISEAVPGTWDASTSKFSAEIQDLTEGEEVLEMKYQASYPYSEDGNVDFGSARTQTGAAYNSIYDLMVAEPVTITAKPGVDESGNAIVFPMQRQTAIAYFHFTSDNTEAITKATLKVEGEGAAIAAETVLLDPTGMDYETGLSEIVLTTTDQTADNFTLWFNVLPTTYTKMTLTVETATKTFTISNTKGGSYTAGKLYKVKKENISWAGEGGSDTPSKVTDVITAAGLTATSTNYADFSNKTFTSSAVYAGQSAKSSNDGIQLRSKYSNSGIVTTVSGGNARKISIVTESGTNTIDIYGKATPYTDATNLYATGNGDQGTKLGSLKCGTDTELEIVGDYPYIGIRSNNGAIYLTSISITWETGSSEPAPCETPVITLDGDKATITCATEGATIRYTLDRSDPVETSDEYTSAITLTEGQTIKAKAFLDGHKASDVASMTYSSSSEGTNYYTKVTSDEDIVDGGKYLIVYDGKAANGCTADVYLTVTDITVENDRIESNTTIDSYAFTINSVEGGYTLKISDNYIGYNTSTKFFKSTTVPTSDKYYWTFTVQTDNSVLIKNVGTDTRFIGANSSTNVTQFRAYSTDNVSKYPQPTLYKLAK